jgi:hypothetical protein
MRKLLPSHLLLLKGKSFSRVSDVRTVTETRNRRNEQRFTQAQAQTETYVQVAIPSAVDPAGRIRPRIPVTIAGNGAIGQPNAVAVLILD